MYQLKKNIYSFFTSQHCRGKGKFILVLSLVLYLALLPERANATCWNFCVFSGRFTTCCTTQEEALDIVPAWACNVHIYARPINDFGGEVYYEQCDLNGNTILKVDAPFLIASDPCPPGSDPCVCDPCAAGCQCCQE